MEINQRCHNKLKQGYYIHRYSEDGPIMLEGNYKDNIRVGIWKSYHKNSKLYWIGSYKNNRQVDLWSYYNAKGQIESEILIII